MYYDEEETSHNDYKDDAGNCVSPTEGNYGDDELKNVEGEAEIRVKRKSRRVIRVEEGDSVEESVKGRDHWLNRQSSSEDDAAVKKVSTRTKFFSSLEETSSPSRNRASTSEDDTSVTRRKSSRTSVSARRASFEVLSSGAESETRSRTSPQKRTSFSSQRAATITGHAEDKRDTFVKSRTKSFESGGRKLSSSHTERPEWSSSTKVEHGRVLSHTMNRKESTTQSESDEPKTAAQIRAKWESRESRNDTHNVVAHKTKAFGGKTGAAAMKVRFENPNPNFKRRTSSSAGHDLEDGKTPSTANLKSRFEQKATEQAAPVKRNFVINKNRTGAAARKFAQYAPVSNKCFACKKTVYPMEKLEADGKLFHKFCFKCTTCSRTVGLGNYAALEGKFYCKPHLKQLFKLKGNYDEGFGREQRKANWVKKDAATNETPVENGHSKNEEIAANDTEDCDN